MKIIAELKRQARNAQRRTGSFFKTGHYAFGDIIDVRYYPVCGRFAFWLGGENISQRDLLRWINGKGTV